MDRRAAGAGSALFLVVAPGVVAGLGPWLITRWRWRGHGIAWLPLRVVGIALIAAGTAVLVYAFVQFVAEGSGTPAPVASTERLVVGGLYRYVRNPMYVAVASIILGQACLLVQAWVVVYAAAFVIVVTAFVATYEEPTLRRQFGDHYVEYCAAVPRWLPRRSPWHRG